MKLTVLAATVAGLLLVTLAGSSPAGGCVRVRAATGTTQTYQQNYHNANVQYARAGAYDHHAAVVVPKVVKVIAHEDYHYSLSDGYRDSLLADAIAFRVLNAQGGYGGKQAPPGERPRADPAPGAFPPPPNTEPVPRAPKPKDADPDAQQATTVPAGLHNVVIAKCLKCHTDANGVNLVDLPSVPEGKRWKAYALVNVGDMPKGGNAIPDEQVKLFYEWAKSK